jgi:hypothetical protein
VVANVSVEVLSVVTSGVIALAGLGLSAFLATRGTTNNALDRQAFLVWRMTFMRPAFRGYFSYTGDAAMRFRDAIEDCLLSVVVGVLRTRSGTVLRRTRGAAEIHRKKHREAALRVSDYLSQLLTTINGALAAERQNRQIEPDVPPAVAEPAAAWADDH